jgi:hypothetical protein|tara:strand:+ start:167 stop:925 length:759 start_codon:yes stop_codon:yes gene_type:complete
MKKKLGLIQTGGLGDIHIALPIAFYYHKREFEIYWPIFDHWVEQMKHYVPWVNWVGISKENKERAYKEPISILDSLKVDKKIPLYSFLGTNLELSNTPYFPHVSFDEFKYIKADVPFHEKWNLNQCIRRDQKRENLIFDKYVKQENYIVTHLKASTHTVDFDRSIIPENFQIIEINNDGFVLDWLKTIEKAKMVFMTNSVMANITEQLNIGKSRHYIPRTNVFMNPTFINKWRWLKNINIDPKTNLTGIKFD